MGGSLLFTSSGTFNPSIYDLKIGQGINYIMIGGGGAGGSWVSNYGAANTGGTNGGSTAIGSYVSVAGGSSSTSGSWYNNSSGIAYGGGGAGGWVPGVLKTSVNTAGSAAYNTSSGNGSMASQAKGYSNIYSFEDEYGEILFSSSSTGGGAGISKISTASGTSLNGANGLSKNGSTATSGLGGAKKANGYPGVGYGAGGGGGAYAQSRDQAGAGYGGNSGDFKQGQFTLTSLSAISITIGIGGTPHTSLNGNSSSYLGGNGASGAVMLFWD